MAHWLARLGLTRAGGREVSGLFRDSVGGAVLPAVLAVLSLIFWSPSARADLWMCPGCPDELVERTQDAPTLECPGCGTTYGHLDLVPPLGFINAATRDSETAWIVDVINCDRYHADGMQAITDQGKVWVPWSMVYWFIPRMRLVKLVDGREFATDYASDRQACPEPPRFVYEVSDTLDVPGRSFQVFEEQHESSLAELFIVAFSPEARDSARARFIQEVEDGLHPRLPRTYPKVYRQRSVHLPEGTVEDGWRGEAVFEVRLHEKRGMIRLHKLEGTGNETLDELALRALRGSTFGVAGELGVGVPTWQTVYVHFEADTLRVELVPSNKGFWR